MAAEPNPGTAGKEGAASPGVMSAGAVSWTASASTWVVDSDFFVGVSPKCASNDSFAAFSISTASIAAAPSLGDCSAVATSPSVTLSTAIWMANKCPIIFVLVSSSYALALLRHSHK